MLARVQSCTVIGVDGHLLDVEVDRRPGTFKVNISGLPDATVRESQDRVVSALRNSGYALPRGHIVISLAPAHLRKEGSALDLPIAVGMAAVSGQFGELALRDYLVVGELGLDGGVRPVAGSLAMAIAARDAGRAGIVLPAANAGEAGVVDGIDVIPVRSLDEAMQFLAGQWTCSPHRTALQEVYDAARREAPDLSDVKGQAHVKRALTVAAAGGHNLLMAGPPGTGKTMLAKRLPGVLPEMDFEEALETTRIYSVAQQMNGRGPLIVERPFREPHHTATTVSISGGGHGTPMPGEVSLAHNGVLFLDELPEFNRSALEVLRQPLEEGFVHIRRANYAVTFPSRFMLVVAMNPCPCGYRTDPRRACRCSTGEIQRYRNRLSGPLLDRIDLHVDVPALRFDELAEPGPSGETTAAVRARVQAARARQQARYGAGDGPFRCNAQLPSSAVQRHCALGQAARGLLETAVERLGLSARAYDKVLRVARTLADLDAVEAIGEQHVAEAVQYRSLDLDQL